MEDSLNSRDTRTVSAPFLLICPANTLPPGLAVIGMDSPVNTDESNWEFPVSITPSRGIFSPGLTIIIWPTSTDSGATSTYPVGVSITALSGLAANKALIDRRERDTAKS